MTIEELKNKWNSEKSFYRTQEVGSGVHSFIRGCLENQHLCALREGSLSSKPESRRKEYIHEKKAKEKRQADFVIYINTDIIIPLEAECCGNIKSGIKQLFNYQKDFDKQYGILTDGYTWRFYNNNVYREFNLNQILEETDIFLEFWKEYIKPEFYYLSFFEPQGQLSLLKDTDTLPVDQNRQIFFDDITKLIKSFKNKLQVEGYFEGLGKKEREKRAIEITYAYIIQFILYKVLVDNDFGKFGEEFKEIVEAIHDCLKTKQYGKILGIIEGISDKISQNIYRPFAKEQKFITDTILTLIRKPKNELHDVSPWLDIFVFIKKYSFANIQNEIFGYIYENYLKELYEEEQKGQYFTDPAIVNFMLKQIGFTPEKLQKRYQFDKNSISLIDPACGSGTFLYSAVNSIIKAFGNHTEEKSNLVEEIVNKNIFGLDIAEFPLYLAEMNILMRMLPLIIGEEYNNPIEKKIKVFLTKDSVAEFLDTALRNTIHDIDVKGGQPSLGKIFEDLDLGYKSYVREKGDLEEMKKSLEKQREIPRRRFDYVIGNPPYVGYNECARQKVLIFELMKQGKVKLNNIYGVNLHSTPDNKKKYAPKPNLYAFFVASGIALLKDNGKLCYICPQTLLTAGDLDVLRYHLAKFTTIKKIITFSGKMFIGRGLKQNKPVATSSLIFVISREKPSSMHQVEIINYKNPDDSIEETLQNILVGKKISKKKILQAKLLQNVANWNLIKQSKAFLDLYNEYKRKTDDIYIYYSHVWAEHQFKSRFYFDIGFILNPKEVLKTGDANNLYELLDFKTFYNYSRFVPTAYYPKDKNKIKLTQNNQGYITLEQRYKIIWSIKNPDRFCFTDHPIIFYMGKASIICSNNENEILYLFSLLNSPITKTILETHLKSEQEKEYLIPIKAIKEFVRVPKITENNQHIKKEIINRTKEMWTLEEKVLSDFVDFSEVMMQKFDSVSVEGNDLVLRRDNRKNRRNIKENKDLIKKVLEEKYNKQGLGLESQKTSLSELKTLPIIDFDRQRKLKDYVDDLVFALYFNIPLNKIGLDKAKEVKEKCFRNPHYETVNKEL